MRFETLIKNTRSQSISIVDTKVNSLRCNNEVSTTVRAYDNGVIGVAGQIGKADIAELKRKAGENLAQGIPYPCIFTKGVTRKEDNSKEIIPDKELVATIASLVKKLSERHPDFCFDNKIETRSLTSHYTNDEGTDLYFADNNLVISLTMRDKRQSNIMDLAYGFDAKCYDEAVVLRDIAALLAAYDVKLDMPTEPLPVLIDQTLVYMLLKDFIAEHNMSGASILSGKLGQRVFSDKLNLAAIRSYNDKEIVPFFDDEGVINDNDRFDLVKNGVLTGLLATKRSASMFNIKCSGTSSSQFDAVPGFGINGLQTLTTNDALSDLTQRAIYVSITSGGDVTADGAVGMPVQLAFLYENGKLIGRLPEFNLSGNIFKVLGDSLLGVSKPDFLHADDTLIVTAMDIK